MKKLARVVVIGLLAVPFFALSGCCNKCRHHYDRDCHHHHKVHQMEKECGGK